MCDNLKSITLPKSVTSIVAYAFDSMSDNFKIYCYLNSAAEKYARKYGFNYEYVDVKRPGTVSGFKVSSITSNTIKLVWNRVSGAQGYIVYKYDNSNKTWIRVAKTKTTSNTYTVSKLSSATTYRFAVKAYKTVSGREITSDKFPQLTTSTNPANVNFKLTAG